MEKNIDSTLIIAQKHTDQTVQLSIQPEKATAKLNKTIDSKANLANLTEAKLWDTQLHDADLNGAFLNGAKLKGAKKTSPAPKAIFRITSLITIALGGVVLTAIIHGFDGRIEIKLGVEGGHVLIDGRKQPSSPLIPGN